MTGINPTPQQAAAITASASGDSIRIDAVAGAGKTSTLVEISKALPSGLGTAFNKAMAEEMTERFAPTFPVKTAHALGNAAWVRHCGKRGGIDKGGENGEYAQTLRRYEVETTDDERRQPLLYVSGFKRIVDTAKALGYLPDGALGGGRSFLTFEELDNQIAVLGLDTTIVNLKPALDFALLTSVKVAWRGEIDFSDMIYMPACFGSPIQQTPCLMVDEAQDISPIQQVLLDRTGAKQRIIVGDPCQAIYAWRGADATAMDTMEKRWKLNRLPLTISFRCPKAVVKQAQAFVSHIESAPTAPEGIVETLDRYDESTFKPGDVIICRFNKPLFQFAFWALKRRIRVTMKGSDVLESLLRVIDKYAKNVANRNELCLLVEAYYQQKIRTSKSDQAADAIRERLECARLVLDEVDPRTPPRNITAEIKSSFDGRVGVELTTIHKAKGREWKRVFNLDFDTWPRRNVRELGGPLLEQEYNMKYVALTRAKEECYFINGGQR